ncbi:MAG: hypothetical protein ACRDSR_08945 [Pseudonocardiaceae bacterium]
MRETAESPICLHFGLADGGVVGVRWCRGCGQRLDGGFDHLQVADRDSGDHGGDQLCGADLLGGEGELLAQPVGLDRDVKRCVRLLQVCALRWGQALAWTRAASAGSPGMAV